MSWPGATANSAGATFPGGNGRIVFASGRVTAGNPEGDAEIFTMNSDGTNVKQLTKNDAHDDDPAWSPDGKRIAYTRTQRGDNDEVSTIRAIGGDQTRLTYSRASDFDADWQPKPR